MEGAPPSRHGQGENLGPAMLQLLGWVGFLGVGYFVRRKTSTGVWMLIGWWAVFWPLLVGSALTGILAFLMLAVWIIVPPLTSLMIYFDSTLIELPRTWSHSSADDSSTSQAPLRSPSGATSSCSPGQGVTEPPPSSRTPGWYKDPWGIGKRWWDGDRWTSQWSR